MNDSVDISAPSYYVDGRTYEPHLVIEDWHLNFNLGNALKYIARAGRKDESTMIEDLKKAQVYLGFEIDRQKMKERNRQYLREIIASKQLMDFDDLDSQT